MDLREAQAAFRFTDWSDLLTVDDGSVFSVLVDGKPALATKVYSEDREDADYDRALKVVVKIGDQFFLKTGWSPVGSHCYGDYGPSWGELSEVFPQEKTLTFYE